MHQQSRTGDKKPERGQTLLKITRIQGEQNIFIIFHNIINKNSAEFSESVENSFILERKFKH